MSKLNSIISNQPIEKINLKEIADKIMHGYLINKQEAWAIYHSDLVEMVEYACQIQKFFCDNTFDVCSIINAKSGRCNQDCRFCSQSSFSKTDAPVYPLLSTDELLRNAEAMYSEGALRFSLVTSGKVLPDKDIDQACVAIDKIIHEVGIKVCVSFGLLNEKNLLKLKDAGVSRIHNNLETSQNFFPEICTTHSFQDKINTLKTAQKVGLETCSGGIFGMGESVQDRLDMAFSLREINMKSIPINILNPIIGTPLEHMKVLAKEEILRVVATYRFILPDAFIRLAGGRGLLDDLGKSCFQGGANAVISGDMLTTPGVSVTKDIAMIESLGYEVKLI